jgi:hypothetical protein
MRRRLTGFAVLFALLLTGAWGAAPPPQAPSGNRNATWEEYRLVLDRNIFSRDRGARPQPRSFRSSVTRTAEDYLILTGVGAQEGLDRVAFFEDAQSGQLFTVSVGRPLGRGILTAISLDSVEYRAAGVTRRIAVGENLTGVVASAYSLAASSQADEEGGSAATTQPLDTAGKSSNDILEKMRQRRLQEIGK